MYRTYLARGPFSSSETVNVFHTKNYFRYIPGDNGLLDLRIPSIHDTLHYIVDLKKTLTPHFKWSKGRNNVSIVLGIPTVNRDKQNYLQVQVCSKNLPIFIQLV